MSIIKSASISKGDMQSECDIQWQNSMGYCFKGTKNFDEQDLKELFSSVGWLSANYPDRLVKAMRNSGTVISVWEGAKLIGLINALDDGEMTAYVHYLLVRPDYQGMGIGKELVEAIKEKYKTYLYIILIAEEKKSVEFYKKCGLQAAINATPMEILNT